MIDVTWIEQALTVTGKASLRRRTLPAAHVAWLASGFARYRRLPLWQVVQPLSLSLDERVPLVPSASVPARQCGKTKLGFRDTESSLLEGKRYRSKAT